METRRCKIFDQNQSPFFSRLPAEVRTTIYELAVGRRLVQSRYLGHGFGYSRILAGNYDGLWRATCSPSLVRHRPRYFAIGIEVDSKTEEEHGGVSPNCMLVNCLCAPPNAELLLVCRLMYRESWPTLYASNYFSFRSVWEYEDFHDQYWRKAHLSGSEPLSTIRKLQIICKDQHERPFAVYANLLSNLKILSLGYQSVNLLVHNLYAPIRRKLQMLFRLDRLPNLQGLDIFWTVWEPGHHRFDRLWKDHDEDEIEAEAEVCSSALAGILNEIVVHPGGHHGFHAEHCKKNEDLGNWVQLQVMSKMAERGYRCESHDYYWSEVAPLIRAGRPYDSVNDVDGNDPIPDLAIIDRRASSTNDNASDEDVEATDEIDDMACRERREVTAEELNELRGDLVMLAAERQEEYKNIYGELQVGGNQHLVEFLASYGRT